MAWLIRQITLGVALTSRSEICRISQAKARIELQADLYASSVLMPRKLVFAAWDNAFPDRKPRVLQPSEPIEHPFVEIARFESRVPGAVVTTSDDRALDNFAKPFAEKFLVSPGRATSCCCSARRA